MKQMLWVIFISGVMFSTASWAGKSDQMIVNEAAQNMVTVAEAKKLPDETAVMLSGVIVRKTHKDHFELKDSSGKIGIEVDSDLWRPMGLKAGDKVKVMGEVDTHTGQATDIDVVQIGKMDNQSDKWTWYNQQ
ncbi:NirD/YgiW/YdeI family stress tolerance protein [Acinetobacter sp.]|uniref:NirD/YgiW/YdeI family stress tolerance protein n=1 Tax=Acinetobacter sp. TaxID=472 RepID=UPI0026472A8C|nr:NirD/YgiW/YdeI family stress tolerance protein [Acinetobacter sp.]MDN5511308.1 NirD/YgiW/YdeI family stress tolerance protein [Acinetobacter sp.]MDN5525567.1 NirD/YgiW/YdeI family stress tolerance protein [Acinetobacter sp.]